MISSSFSRRIVLGLGAVALLSLGGLHAASAQTIANSGFESPVVGANDYHSFAYNPTNAGWTFSGNSGVSGNNSGFTYANPAAPEGAQIGFLQTDGTISQAIDGFTAGDYTFSFLSAQRGGGNSPGTDHQNFQVSVDGTALYGENGLLPTSADYQFYTTGPVTLSAGTHTLTFQGLDTAYAQYPANSSDNTACLDGVGVSRVAPVPEASSVISLGMLMTLGLGGALAARKKSARA